MMPATSQNPKNFRRQVGSALWLFALLARFTPAEWMGDASAWVAGGNIVPDAELAERLAVSQGTISRWRHRLRAAGLIGWLVAPRQGRVFWVSAVNRFLGAHDETKPPERKPTEDSSAAKTKALTESAVSRWIQ